MAITQTTFKPGEYKIEYLISRKAAELRLLWRVERVLWHAGESRLRFAWRKVGQSGAEVTILEPETDDPDEIIAAVIATMELSC